jgi:hypothetical protein
MTCYQAAVQFLDLSDLPFAEEMLNKPMISLPG